MKKQIAAVMGVLCLGVSITHAGNMSVGFDDKASKPGEGTVARFVVARTFQQDQIAPPTPAKPEAEAQTGNKEGTLKNPDSCAESVKNDFFRNLYFIDARPMFTYDYLPKLLECSSEQQVSHLLEYLGDNVHAPAQKGAKQVAPKYPTRECTTSNGCRYCKECGYICLKKEGDVCIKWSDKEVCWWELDYCTAK